MRPLVLPLMMGLLTASAVAAPVGLTALAAFSTPGPLMLSAAPSPAPNGATTATPPRGYPQVEITKTCPSLRYVSREATFVINVTNKGTGPAANVVVTDTITGGLQILTISDGGTREGDRIVWRLGTLGPGQSRELTITARCDQIGTIRNQAVVSYCAESAAECQLEVKGIPAILIECVDDPDPIEVGKTVTYTIIVTNQGSAVGTNIAITCTLPEEQEFVNAGGATAGTGAGKTVTFAPLPSLAPKAQARFTVTTRGLRSGDTRFRVTMKSDQLDSIVEETESTRFYD